MAWGLRRSRSRDRPRGPYGPLCCDCGDEVMGLFDALTSAVSGLQAQSFAMQNISGNIANSQTIAYKGINTSFEDLIPASRWRSQQTAGGVIATSVGNQQRAGRDPERDRRAPTWPSMATAISSCSRRPALPATRRSSAASTAIRAAATSSSTRKAIWSTAPAIISKACRSTRPPAIRPAPPPLRCNSRTTSCRPTRRPQSPTASISRNAADRAYSSTVANSELLNPADFTVDPTTAGAGVVIGTTPRHSQ